MKLIIPMLLLLLSCNSNRSHEPVITHKFTTDFSGDQIGVGLCRFYYINENGYEKEFVDSCHKYNVLDTIVGRKRTY